MEISYIPRKLRWTDKNLKQHIIEDADLSSFYTNPLTLNFIAAIVRAEGTIPDTRAKLFKLAVEQLRLEPNERYKESPLASLAGDFAFDAGLRHPVVGRAPGPVTSGPGTSLIATATGRQRRCLAFNTGTSLRRNCRRAANAVFD